MKFVALGICCVACTAGAIDVESIFDRLDRALTVAAFQNQLRARISGTLDLERYHFDQPPPGLITSQEDTLFNSRLTLFLDAQYGSPIYFFVQTRVDRGFDPSDQGVEIRLDEYAVRFTPWKDGQVSVQIGKFATVVGNWVPRHLSWENPFINAPLIYENVTAVRDHYVYLPSDFHRELLFEKYEFNPVIWGPSYASGISVAGKIDKFEYAAEMKNASLSSRPESWSVTNTGFDHPTVSGRLGFRPDEAWNIGISASEGTYFRSEAKPMLPRGREISDYREYVLGQDVSYALHHLELWAELYEARFEVPAKGDGDTFAYYIEARYQFTPQFFGAIRWNQQLFADVGKRPDGNNRWGDDVGRIDIAGTYRFTSYTQLKLQYSFAQQTSGPRDESQLFAAQFSVRF